MKTFCITLPEWPERTQRAAQHFTAAGLDVHMVQGIHADNAGLQTRHTYDIDHPEEKFNVGPKHVGIWLGHYLLWTVAASHPESHFLLLEDDAILTFDFKARFNQAMSEVPSDFDMLFVGSCCTKGHPSTHVRGDIWDVRWPQCNHAYVVAKKFLPVLLSQRKIYGPVDGTMIVDIFRKKEGLKVFTVLPRLADQRDTFLHP